MDKTAVDISDSILLSIKKLLGYTREQNEFDPDIIMHINGVFFNLNQLGVGPKEGFSINDETTLWTEFLPKGVLLSAVNSYVYLKVRLVFDPPTNSSVIKSIENSIDELEWRINSEIEKQLNKGGKNQNG